MNDILALATIIAWPVIPLFWIPVHLFSNFFRKIKLLTYVIPLLTWLPLAYILYKKRALLLHAKIDFPLILNVFGLILSVLGTSLHIWTMKLLSPRGLIGVHEIYSKAKGRVVKEGAFSVVRHPTYLAHTIIFSGVFLMTGVIAVCVVTLLDFLLINFFIIPLEEKELESRFGEEYYYYKNDVPRFFPRLIQIRRK